MMIREVNWNRRYIFHKQYTLEKEICASLVVLLVVELICENKANDEKSSILLSFVMVPQVTTRCSST